MTYEEILDALQGASIPDLQDMNSAILHSTVLGTLRDLGIDAQVFRDMDITKVRTGGEEVSVCLNWSTAGGLYNTGITIWDGKNHVTHEAGLHDTVRDALASLAFLMDQGHLPDYADILKGKFGGLK